MFAIKQTYYFLGIKEVFETIFVLRSKKLLFFKIPRINLDKANLKLLLDVFAKQTYKKHKN